MGQPKALMPLAGKPLIRHVIDAFQSAGEVGPIVVVTGHAAEQLSEILSPLPVHLVHNPAYASGEMLSSVKQGVAAVLESAEPVDAFFIALADQPRISPQTISLMCKAWSDSRPSVLLPTYRQKHGHPILLGAGDANEILSLPPEATLKSYTSRHAKHTLELDVDDPAVQF